MWLPNDWAFGLGVRFRKRCAALGGVKEVTLPGDTERRVLADRSTNGIPLDDGNWQALVKLAGELSIAVPSV